MRRCVHPTSLLDRTSRIHLIKHQHSFSIFWLYFASYHSIFVSLFILLHITTILVWAEVLTFHCSTYISLHCFSVLRDVEHFISISNYIKLLIAIATIIGVISFDQVIFSLVWHVAHTNHWSQRMYSGSCPFLSGHFGNLRRVFVQRLLVDLLAVATILRFY